MSTHGRRRRLNKRKGSKHVNMGRIFGELLHIEFWRARKMQKKWGSIKPEGKRVPSMIRVPRKATQNEISSLNWIRWP